MWKWILYENFGRIDRGEIKSSSFGLFYKKIINWRLPSLIKVLITYIVNNSSFDNILNGGVKNHCSLAVSVAHPNPNPHPVYDKKHDHNRRSNPRRSVEALSRNLHCRCRLLNTKPRKPHDSTSALSGDVALV